MLRRYLIIFCLLVSSCAGQLQNEAGFNKYATKLYAKALDQGFERDFLDSNFASLEFSEKYIREDRKQFRKQSFNEYYQNAVNDLRTRQARQKLKKHKKPLAKISKKYQIAPEYLVALWAIESSFGKSMGNFPVLNAHANLAYEGRRRKLFETQFFAALKIIQQNNFTADKWLGSWAGASGQCQFLPTTYLDYAVPYSGAEHPDIWGNSLDSLSSSANYLQQIGWDYNLPWGFELEANTQLKKISTEKNFLLKDLLATKSVKPTIAQSFTKYQLEQPVNLISYDTRYFVVFKNFHVIKEWNNSNYFALTVGLFANKLSQ